MKKSVLFSAVILFAAFVPQKDNRKFEEAKKLVVPVATKLYFGKTEVRNKEYKEFLYDFVRHGKREEVYKYMPDITVWANDFEYKFNDPMTQNYFSHPAFDNYPLVGINYEGAVAFCEWMTEKYNDEESTIKIRFRLPTKEEWILASKGRNENTKYAGGLTDIKDEKGHYQFNHRVSEDDFAKDYYEYTGPAIKPYLYKPDGFGLSCMAGNVAEMISEKGIAMGGSWKDYSDEMLIGKSQTYDAPHSWVGFRYVMEITE